MDDYESNYVCTVSPGAKVALAVIVVSLIFFMVMEFLHSPDLTWIQLYGSALVGFIVCLVMVFGVGHLSVFPPIFTIIVMLFPIIYYLHKYGIIVVQALNNDI